MFCHLSLKPETALSFSDWHSFLTLRLDNITHSSVTEKVLTLDLCFLVKQYVFFSSNQAHLTSSV